MTNQIKMLSSLARPVPPPTSWAFLLGFMLVPQLSAQSNTPGPNILAKNYLASLGMVDGDVAHVGDCNISGPHNSAVASMKIGPLVTPAECMAEAKGIPTIITGPNGQSVKDAVPEKKPFCCYLEFGPTDGGCSSLGPDDHPNCCNYESLEGARIYLSRTFEKKTTTLEYYALKIDKVRIPGPVPIEVPVPEELWESLQPLTGTVVGETLVMGPWTIDRSDRARIDLCLCDVETDPDNGTVIPMPEWPEGEIPHPDGPYSGAPTGTGLPGRSGQTFDADRAIGLPVTIGEDPPVPSCTALNDYTTGSAIWSTETVVTQWGVRTFSIAVGYDELCELKWENWHYRWVEKCEWQARLHGEVICHPNPVSGGAHPHTSHGSCLDGCHLENAIKAKTVGYTREANFQQVMDEWTCTYQIGRKEHTPPTGMTVSFSTDIDPNVSAEEPVDWCYCDGSIPPDPGGVSPFSGNVIGGRETSVVPPPSDG